MIGIVGAGQMAQALAHGWSEPVLCTDRGSGAAAALARETGGQALEQNVELARRADLVVLCHKPAALQTVAREVDGRARAVASVLSGVSLDALTAAYTQTPVFRLAVNLPAQVRRGTICYAGASQGAPPDLEAEVLDRFGRLGKLRHVTEEWLPAIVSLTGVGPAYLSVVVEAQVDAAVRHGLPAAEATALATEVLAGTAELLRPGGVNTLELRRSVTSPGGVTARGLAALEAAGLRHAFHQAADAVMGGSRGG